MHVVLTKPVVQAFTIEQVCKVVVDAHRVVPSVQALEFTGAAAQVPAAPVQTMHVPQDATLQQRPSVQTPLAHSLPPPQASPSRNKPVPARATLGLPPGVELTVNVADLAPALDGLKVTTTLQRLPPASAPAQVVEAVTIRNWSALVPPRAGTTPVVAPAVIAPVLVTTKVWVALTCPIWVPA